MKKVVLLAFVSVLFSTAVFAEFIRPVEASGTINIDSDYTFTSNIYEPIVVTADNIIIDGAGYTVQGTGSGTGINMTWRSNVTLKNVEVTNFYYGIYLSSSTNNTITGNTASSNYGTGIYLDYSSNNNTVYGNTASSNYGTGIYLDYSSNNNTVYGNTASSNGRGIYLWSSSNNTVYGNTASSNNEAGIWLQSSSNNALFHNNFIDNTQQVYVSPDSLDNVWDDGYPSGGNYWSDYPDVDLLGGPYQNETGSDGIGDTAHILDAKNTDNYPLMGMFSDFKATSEYHVQTICNSSISDFQYNGTAISFNVTGETDTTGFCRICIPRALMNETYQVFVNGTEVQCNLLPCSNTTHSYLYFTYNLSTQKVIIIPEFPPFLILPLFMIATLLAVIVYRRKHSLKQTIKNQLRARMEGLKLFRKRK